MFSEIRDSLRQLYLGAEQPWLTAFSGGTVCHPRTRRSRVRAGAGIYDCVARVRLHLYYSTAWPQMAELSC